MTMLPALESRLPLCETMTAEQVALIDAASMDILEEVGVVFRDPVVWNPLEKDYTAAWNRIAKGG